MFICPDCGITSHHPKDEENRYCGACKKFFSDAMESAKDVLDKENQVLVAFLYILMRDYVKPEIMESVIKDHCAVLMSGKIKGEFTNQWRAAKAREMALRLTSSTEKPVGNQAKTGNHESQLV